MLLPPEATEGQHLPFPEISRNALTQYYPQLPGGFLFICYLDLEPRRVTVDVEEGTLL